MAIYPQYRFDHFFRLSYIEGGLTIQQVQALYETYCKRIHEEREFLAAIHGIDTKGGDKKKDADQIEQKQGLPLFRDPSEYEGMTQEEKNKITQEMMGKHRGWVNSMSLPVGK